MRKFIQRAKRPVGACAVAVVAALVFVTAAHSADKVDNKALIKLIDQRIEKKLSELRLDDAHFNDRVEEGIRAYILKQRATRDQAQRNKARNLRPVTVRDHVRGDPKAPISLVEYSDYECPYCKRFHPTAQQIVKAYPGKVNWVYRQFPLSFHAPGAQKEAEAAECVAELGGNDAFWAFSDRIFERTHSNGQGFPVKNLAPLAQEVGVDRAKLTQCLDSGRMTASVKRSVAEGEAAGVNGTPGNFLVDNRTGRVVPLIGARPFEQFKAVIDRMLEEGAKEGSDG